MSPLIIGIIGIVILMVLLLSGLPIEVSMGMLGVGGLWIMLGPDVGFSILKIAPYDAVAKYGFAVVPLFILIGSFCFQAGVSKNLYFAVNAWIGHFRGGIYSGSLSSVWLL